MPKRTGRTATVTALLMSLWPSTAPASLGPFEHGNGVKAMGRGGVSYALGGETTALGGNPAHAIAMGPRFDVGLSFLVPRASGVIRGNDAAEDERYDSRPVTVPIPQGGAAYALAEDWALAFNIQSAGIGPEYEDNPYGRFGGGSRAELALGQSGLAITVAHRLTPDQHVGAALNLSYQRFEVQGLQGFTAPEGEPNNASVAPEAVTNRATDDAFGVGFTLGWKGALTERLWAAASYRSPTWTQKHDAYRGLLPEGGKLDLPAIYGAGLGFAATPELTLAFDFQRYHYSAQKAFGNQLAQLAAGNRLGSEDGPGFGFRNQNAYKFGIEWQTTPALTLRAGYIHAEQVSRRSETLFAFLGAVMVTTHYTAGASYEFGDWELSGFYSYAPKQTVHGRNSIPDSLGGGEADVGLRVQQFGLSAGRHFGGG